MKKRIILSIGALLLLLSVVTSVAWLSNFEKKKVKSVNVDYQNGMMTIADKNFDACKSSDRLPLFVGLVNQV